VQVLLSDVDQTVEQEPNNEPAKANRVSVPGGVTGRFLDKGDLDHFAFLVKKGQKYAVTAMTHEVGSPAEVYMVLRAAPGPDGKPGAEFGKTDPQKPPRIEFTAPADGDVILAVEHLNYAFGPNEVYHLDIAPVGPDFDVSLGLDRIELSPGGTAVIPVLAPVRRDYTGPIELKVVGHPGINGTVTIANATVPPNLPAAFLTVAAAPDLPRGAYDLRVQAKANVNGQDIVKLASVDGVVRPGLGGLAFPPRDLLVRLAAASTDKPPFALTAKLATPEAARGVAANAIVTAVRAADFPDEIALTAVALPPNVAAAPKNIAKATNEGHVALTPAVAAVLGSSPVAVIGKGKYQGRDFAVVAAPIALTVVLPFELKAEPAELKLAPGGKAKLKVTAVRKGGYEGPIDLELRNLPAGVTTAKASIPTGKTEAELELTAGEKAAAATKADVNALGTAPAAANQQAATPNFKVTVAK
jgi:hypothetical protein